MIQTALCTSIKFEYMVKWEYMTFLILQNKSWECRCLSALLKSGTIGPRQPGDAPLLLLQKKNNQDVLSDIWSYDMWFKQDNLNRRLFKYRVNIQIFSCTILNEKGIGKSSYLHDHNRLLTWTKNPLMATQQLHINWLINTWSMKPPKIRAISLKYGYN
jgi:hypothetical protein